jgi:predicted GNAT family N-acyltransferase
LSDLQIEVSCNHKLAVEAPCFHLYHEKPSITLSAMSEKLQVRDFDIREANWTIDGALLSNIRRLVFIVEQEVPQEEEWDGKDEDSWHWLATDASDNPIGTARLLPDGQIGRMAVLADKRGSGVGAVLLEQAVEKARHLGMQEVFLNAQSHALGFYERCGFVAEGDEFMEAGIPHFRMTRQLSPPEDNIQRHLGGEHDPEMKVKNFDTLEADWQEIAGTLKRLRRQVFINELGLGDLPLEDQSDADAIHWIAENRDGHINGFIRMSATGVVSWLAVTEKSRRQGIGTSLVEIALQRGRRYKLDRLVLDMPFVNEAFLSHLGFEVLSDGTWQLEIEDEKLPDKGSYGESLEEDGTYQLGVNKQLILLRGEKDFRNVLLEMTSQAHQSIRIYSPVLDHALYDDSELMEICSRLARRNRYTKVEILVFDPHRMIKNGHALLNIARKLPSSIGIKVVDPEMRQQNHEYVLVDGQGFLYRGEYDQYEGSASFMNISECNRLGRQFTASWESGLLDPNLRQLRI